MSLGIKRESIGDIIFVDKKIYFACTEEINAYILNEFNNYINSPMAVYKDELYNLPFNMNTFSKIWSDVFTPEEAKAKIEQEKKEAGITEPKNLEEQAISMVGKDIYEILIKGYTGKQWGKPKTNITMGMVSNFRYCRSKITIDGEKKNKYNRGIIK